MIFDCVPPDVPCLLPLPSLKLRYRKMAEVGEAQNFREASWTDTVLTQSKVLTLYLIQCPQQL